MEEVRSAVLYSPNKTFERETSLAALMIILPRKLSFGKIVILFIKKSCFLFTLNKKIKQLAIQKINTFFKQRCLCYSVYQLFSRYVFIIFPQCTELTFFCGFNQLFEWYKLTQMTLCISLR